jgi:NADH dehydrogenase
LPDFESAYAIGDISAAEIAEESDREGEKKMRYATPTAESAVEEGKYVGKQLALLLNHSSKTSRSDGSKSEMEQSEFHFKERGTMLSIGIHKGIAQFPHVTFAGYLGWLTWRIVHLYLVSSTEDRLRVLFDWTFGSFGKRNISQLD